MSSLKTDRLYVYLGYLLLVTSLVTGVTFSRYSTTISNVESQNVMTLKTVSGDFDVDVEAVTEELVFDEQNPRMDTQEFEFCVKNNTEEKVEATIEMNWKDSKSKMNMPLEFAIYSGDEKIYPKRGKVKTKSLGVNKLKAEIQEIDENSEQSYIIKWSWDRDEDRYVYAGKETEIDIKVKVTPKVGNIDRVKNFELVAKSSDFLFNHDGYSSTVGIENNEAYIDLELSNYIDDDVSKEDIKYFISIEDEYGENQKFDLKVDDIEYINDKTRKYKLKGGEGEAEKKRIYFKVSPESIGTLNIVENVRVKITTTEPFVKESIFNVFITNDSLIKFRLEDWFTVPLPTRKLKIETDKTFKPMVETEEILLKINWDDGLDVDLESKYIKKNISLEENKDSIINGGTLKEYYIKMIPNEVIEVNFFENGTDKEKGIDVETYLIRENKKLIHHTDWNFN